MSLQDLRALAPEAVRHLVDVLPGAFSAATVWRGSRRTILVNPAHPPGRQANSLAHELAHVLLEHDPHPVLDGSGARRWEDAAEKQADWFAGVLLVPRDGMIATMARAESLDAAADHYGVSVPLMRWRVNQTGVANQLRARGYVGL